jgi:threonyl-tRNA synthetase
MKITFPDGNVREYQDGTNGYDIALSISEGLARNALGILLNGSIHELYQPINEDANLNILTFNDDEGKQMFWHSSAHLMAEALQALYPGIKFGIGPSIEQGFYYDVMPPEGTKIIADDLAKIESKMKELINQKSRFEKYELSGDEAEKYYTEKGNEFKLELIRDLKAKGENISFCKQGEFTDLCRGGHIPNVSVIKSIKLLSIAGAYWRGDSTRPMMTRIYGITFPKKAMLDEFIEQRAEAEKRDHRKLGKELELFTISPVVGQGLPMWLPRGARMRRILEEFMRQEQIRRGYLEVLTPHIGNLNMYKTSGHYPYYSDSQFPPMKVEDEEYMMKPMNCPHHHQIYSIKPRSYRDLPLRIFEYGTVYRYEQSGELSGLSRVRGFTQDDAHIYCTPEQLKSEIKNVVDIIHFFFKTFGLDKELVTRLSFRDNNDEKYSGSAEQWEQAQQDIKEAADEMGLNYVIELGEASFYGPKIDFVVKDAIGRKWQLGTCQVDYVMPERFNLEYTGNDNSAHRPVCIHRAPVGSIERFTAILIEHFAGNFPFWLAPEQISILPIGEAQYEYCRALDEKLTILGYRTIMDLRSERVNRKIAESEQMKIPYALVIGQKEADNGMVTLRKHGEGDLGIKSIDEILTLFAKMNVPGML